MLSQAKLAVLRIAEATGVSHLLARSDWRRRRLLILCYHGISLDDEHLWNPDLFMPAGLVRQRFQALRDRRCSVLSLAEGIDRLYAGTLPPLSVALTFDDGFYDFYRQAGPLLREFNYPATVYMTTYYSDYNRPAFNVMSQYLLWKAGPRRLAWPEILHSPLTLDSGGRVEADRRIRTYAKQHQLTGRQKDELLSQLAGRLGIDYEALCAKRILNLMTPAEAAEMARAGIDFQLHTHRHRVSTDHGIFLRQIEDNRTSLANITPAPARHFCYPSGCYRPEFPPWLREAGVVSATTCENGIASRSSEPLLLPRLLDRCSVTQLEFVAWLSGLASLLPHRSHAMSQDQLLGDSC